MAEAVVDGGSVFVELGVGDDFGGVADVGSVDLAQLLDGLSAAAGGWGRRTGRRGRQGP
jgi:hypothetical protein